MIWRLMLIRGSILFVLTMNDFLTRRIFLPALQTANAHIIRENQTLNNELKEQQEKTGQVLVESDAGVSVQRIVDTLRGADRAGARSVSLARSR